MRTKIIILAQGTQQRLIGVTTPKCLLPLPACSNAPIVGRTLRMLQRIENERTRDNFVIAGVVLVSWAEVFDGLRREAVRLSSPAMLAFDPISLPAPGNSSLKGIRRYCDNACVFGVTPDDFDQPTRYAVLFGDTVYSWAALGHIVKGIGCDAAFVGTENLSNSGGELWGVSWVHPRATMTMSQALDQAMEKHPPVTDIYQPGQMRNWLWAIDRALTGTSLSRIWWRAEIGYTMDVDLPEHIPLLRGVSEIAAHDDAAHGMEW